VTDRIRILVVVDSTGLLGGVHQSALELGSALAALGHEIHLVSGDEGELIGEWSTIAASRTVVPNLRTSLRQPLRTLRAVRRLRAAIRRVDPDVVYFQYWTQLGLVRWCVPRGVAVAVHLRSTPPLGTASHRRLGRVLPRCDVAIAVSETTAQEWRSAYPDAASRIHGVLNGVDADRLRRRGGRSVEEVRASLGVAPTDRVTLFVGRISPDKGVDDLLAALDRLPVDDRPTLVVVGDPLGARSEVRDGPRLLAALDDAGALVVPPTPDIASYIASADVLVLPSRAEGLPRVVMEAVVLGIPAVATDVGGVGEILTGDLARFVVPVGDVDGLAAAITDALDHPPSDSGMAQAAAHLDVARAGAEVERVFVEHLPG
jgi:glycosyltransferase involved in cell wall biosynthesis